MNRQRNRNCVIWVGTYVAIMASLATYYYDPFGWMS